MGKEIERKFLLMYGVVVPIPQDSEKTLIKQGYIHADMEKHVRVRIYDSEPSLGVIGIKYTESLVRDEFEFEIPIEDAQFMYDKSDMKLEKKRISFVIGDEHYDLDYFPNGLSFVEVEFKSIEAMGKWEKPNWIGEEITGVKEYSNITLAKKNLKFYYA